MLKEVYKAIKKAIGDQIDGINDLDWYLGQYDQDGDNTLYTTPAVYIEFQPMDWEQLKVGVQACNLMVSIHAVNASLYDTDQRILDAASNHLELENSVYRALQGFRCMLSYLPEYAGLAGGANDRVLLESMVRQRTYPDHDINRLLVSVQEFKTRIYDYSAEPQYQEVIANLNLTAEKATIVEPPFRSL